MRNIKYRIPLKNKTVEKVYHLKKYKNIFLTHSIWGFCNLVASDYKINKLQLNKILNFLEKNHIIFVVIKGSFIRKLLKISNSFIFEKFFNKTYQYPNIWIFLNNFEQLINFMYNTLKEFNFNIFFWKYNKQILYPFWLQKNKKLVLYMNIFMKNIIFQLYFILLYINKIIKCQLQLN